MVARSAGWEWDVFRGESREKNYAPDVGLGACAHYNPALDAARRGLTEPSFRGGVAAPQECEPFERAVAPCLLEAVHRFFFYGAKRPSRFLMDGALLSYGIDVMSQGASGQ